MKAITTLTSALFSTGINPLTNSEIEEGTIEVGALVKDAVKIGENVRFLASTDGGNCWYHERADSDEFKAAAPDASVSVVDF